MAQKKLVDNAEFDWDIYTDGSATEGCKNGGSAAIITKRPMTLPNLISVLQSLADEHCSSYQCEMVAINIALKWLA